MSTAEHQHGAVRETPDRYAAFPRLTPEQLQDLTAHGERRRTAEGEVLYREGEPFREFLAILSGTVELLHDHGGPGERTVAVQGPGRFLGELGLLEIRAIHRTRCGWVSSPPATGCPTDGWIWRRTRRPTRCCAGSRSDPRRPRWSSGRASGCCAIRATPNSPGSSGCPPPPPPPPPPPRPRPDGAT
uniref:cyclic nucleotide-binding domain-containing protein n=1 Tax=Streptomyces rimosus TaxID=1927 RepID=UPI00373AE3A7